MNIESDKTKYFDPYDLTKEEALYYINNYGMRLYELPSDRRERQIVLAAVKKDGNALQYANDEIKADRGVVLTAVKKDGSALKYASDDLKADREVVLTAVKNDGSALEYACDELMADREVVLTAVKNDGSVMEYACDELKADREVMLTAVKDYDYWSYYANEELMADKDFILKAVKKNGLALENACDELKADKKVVLAAVKQSGLALRYADESLKSDKDVVLTAVIQDGDALQYACDELKADREVVIATVGQDGMTLIWADNSFRTDKDVIRTAVMQNGRALQYADERLRADKDIVLAAVMQDGGALQYAHYDLKEDKDVVYAAVKQSFDAVKYADQSIVFDILKNILTSEDDYVTSFCLDTEYANRFFLLYKDSIPEILPEIIKREPSIITRFPEKLPESALENKEILTIAAKNGYFTADSIHIVDEEIMSDREVLLNAVKRDGSMLQFLSKTSKSDPEIVTAAIMHDPAALQYADDSIKYDKKWVDLAFKRYLFGGYCSENFLDVMRKPIQKINESIPKEHYSRFAKDHKIGYFIHCTSRKNLLSILDRGRILTRESVDNYNRTKNDAEKMDIFDDARLDDQKNTISLTISKVHPMFFVKDNADSLCVIRFSTEDILTDKCLFFEKNAAHHDYYSDNCGYEPSMRYTFYDFVDMFDGFDSDGNLTTFNRQAEIMHTGDIPISRIHDIAIVGYQCDNEDVLELVRKKNAGLGDSSIECWFIANLNDFNSEALLKQ